MESYQGSQGRNRKDGSRYCWQIGAHPAPSQGNIFQGNIFQENRGQAFVETALEQNDRASREDGFRIWMLFLMYYLSKADLQCFFFDIFFFPLSDGMLVGEGCPALTIPPSCPLEVGRAGSSAPTVISRESVTGIQLSPSQTPKLSSQILSGSQFLLRQTAHVVTSQKRSHKQNQNCSEEARKLKQVLL